MTLRELEQRCSDVLKSLSECPDHYDYHGLTKAQWRALSITVKETIRSIEAATQTDRDHAVALMKAQSAIEDAREEANRYRETAAMLAGNLARHLEH